MAEDMQTPLGSMRNGFRPVPYAASSNPLHDVSTSACFQHGASPVGVSLAFTVRAMDAGPVLDSDILEISDHWQAPQVLEHLFQRGTQ